MDVSSAAARAPSAYKVQCRLKPTSEGGVIVYRTWIWVERTFGSASERERFIKAWATEFEVERM